jgi:hypothetical protein
VSVPWQGSHEWFVRGRKGRLESQAVEIVACLLRSGQMGNFRPIRCGPIRTYVGSRKQSVDPSSASCKDRGSSRPWPRANRSVAFVRRTMPAHCNQVKNRTAAGGSHLGVLRRSFQLYSTAQPVEAASLVNKPNFVPCTRCKASYHPRL